MTEALENPVMRRRRLDHERYMAHREERKEKQRAYYREHRDELLAKVRLRRLGLYVKPAPTDEEREAARERKRERDRAYYWRRRGLLTKDNPTA